jgi:tetratricopeptide (TPR) repeat protein
VAALATEPGRPRDRAFYRRAAELIAQAADALEHAHGLGIVHRDVKPANLLLDAAGKVYVSDFGLARFGADAGLTMTGDLLGTLRYMAPEQALAKHNLVDHRADGYGLGATLYELLTGRPAVAGEDKQEILHNIAFADPVPPRKLDKAIPAELETITLKGLAKSPAERYATAGELAEDLNRFLADRPIRARPPTLARRASKWAARHGAALASAAAVLLLAVAVLVAGVLWHDGRLRAEAANTARERDVAREEQRWASQAVDDMYTQVAEQWLGPQPRLQPLQRTFLEKALAYYQHAVEHWGDNPAVRRKVPELYFRVGTIHAALGRHDRAEDALRKAVAGFEELAATNPGDTAVRNDLVASHTRLGQTLQATGRFPEAAEVYRRSFDLAVKQVHDFPDRPDFRSRPPIAKSNLAFALARAGRTEEAERSYHEALAELDRLPPDVRDRADARSLLANTRNNLGNLYFAAGRFAAAELPYRQAAAGFERLTTESPANTDYREQWAFTLSNLGAALNMLGRTPEARPVLTQAESVMGRLAADFPDLSDLPSELAGIQINLGAVLRKLGEVAEAEKFYRKAVGTLGTLAARFPAVPEHRSRLGAARFNLGRLLREVGRLADAERALCEAVETREKLADEFPEVPVYRASQAEALFGLGNTLTRAGKFGGADEAYTRALGLQEALLAGESANPAYRGALASTCNNLALLLAWEQGPPYPGADRAVDLAKRAVELDPQGGSRWRTLGWAHFRAGHWRECLSALERARQLSTWYGADDYFEAIARWHLGEKGEASRHYHAGIRWLEKQASPARQVLHLHDEAEALLGAADRNDGTDKTTRPPGGGR